MRKRTNKISIWLSDTELKRLNEMVGKTIFSREAFIRTMLAGYQIRAALPAPLHEAMRLLRNAGWEMKTMVDHCRFKEVEDRELLQKTVREISACTNAIMEQCLPMYKERKRKK